MLLVINLEHALTASGRFQRDQLGVSPTNIQDRPRKDDFRTSSLRASRFRFKPAKYPRSSSIGRVGVVKPRKGFPL